jgi:Fe-S cluster assembly iron-binding protein IscA
MITSEKATEKLKEEMLNRFKKLGLGFRVYQDKEGENDSRLALKLDKINSDDEILDLQGVRLYLDPVIALKFKDLELDYIDGPSGGFIIKDHWNN